MASNKNKRTGTRLLNDGFLEACLEVDFLNWTEDENTPRESDEYKKNDGEGEHPTRSKLRRKNQTACLKLVSHTSKMVITNFNADSSILNNKPETTNPFDELADEIILYLFSFLSHKSLTKCVQVSRRWKRLGYDEILWKEVTLHGKHFNVGGVLGSILHRGVRIARLSKAEVLAPVCLTDKDFALQQQCDNFSLQQLDASMSNFSDDNLACLLFRCNSLKYLSLESCKVGLREITAISYNHHIEVLNLALTIGMTTSAIDVLTRKCSKLRSLNLSWTNQTRDCLRYICRCKDLEELNLSGLRGGINRSAMEKLVTSCLKLVELDFSDVTLQIGTMKLVADNCRHLQKLSISRCSDVKPEQLQNLVKLSSLSHLNLFGFVNSAALECFCDLRPDIYINKETFSPIARPISTACYEGRLWENYSGFII